MPTNSRSKTSGAAGGADERNGALKTGNGSVANAGNGGTTAPGILGGIKQNVTSRVDEQ